MGLNKKQYGNLLGPGVVLLFFISRFYNILAIPIFTDESIYIRWAQLFRDNSHQVFVSLVDGKQPFFIWVASVFLRFMHDPLLAGRLTSVLTGLFTMAGIYFLSKELFKDRKVALIASLVYVIYPFSLLYDKLALYDSMLATFAVWSLYIEVLLVKRRSFGVAVLSILIISGGLFTKSSAFFFLYLLPFSLLLFDAKPKRRNQDFRRWLGLALLVAAGAVACYSILRLSPNFHYIADKNNVFIYPFHEWLKHPFTYLLHNTRFMLGILVGYSTVSLLLLVALAFFIDRQFTREKLLLLAWFIVPFVALALFGKLIYPRYILFMAMPLLVLAAYSVSLILKKINPGYLGVLIVLVLALPMLGKDHLILTDFAKAAVPKSDHVQYIEGFDGGVGVKEAVTYLKQRTGHNQKIYIATEGTFGLMPDALQDYFDSEPNVTIKGYWPIETEPPQEILNAAKTQPTYAIFYAPCPLCGQIGTAPPDWPLRQVLQIRRLDKGSFFTLYQVIPTVRTVN
jgi:4-amino-4-deoxy-L-arabinose transferase-like glycosyltransferase